MVFAAGRQFSDSVCDSALCWIISYIFCIKICRSHIRIFITCQYDSLYIIPQNFKSLCHSNWNRENHPYSTQAWENHILVLCQQVFILITQLQKLYSFCMNELASGRFWSIRELFKILTLTRPIGLPFHAPVAQKIADQRWHIANSAKKIRLFI